MKLRSAFAHKRLECSVQFFSSMRFNSMSVTVNVRAVPPELQRNNKTAHGSKVGIPSKVFHALIMQDATFVWLSEYRQGQI